MSNSNGPQYVIWSFEHQAWWAPDRQGYTTELEQAGRYTAAEAGDIVTSSIELDEVAILEAVVVKWYDGKPPQFHPYKGLAT